VSSYSPRKPPSHQLAGTCQLIVLVTPEQFDGAVKKTVLARPSGQ